MEIPCVSSRMWSRAARTEPEQHARFGPFEVDLRSRELFLRGEKVGLQEKPFEVLVALLGNVGDVVLREELYERLWPGRIVEYETNLSTAVAKLRRALGESAQNPRFIETLPGRGYRFLTPALIEDAAGGAEQGRGSQRIGSLGSLLGAAALIALGVGFSFTLQSPGSSYHGDAGRTLLPSAEPIVQRGAGGPDAIGGVRSVHDVRRCPKGRFSSQPLD